MADKKLTDLSVLPDPDGVDIMHVVDVSDLTGGANGTSKQATLMDIVIAGIPGFMSPENQIIINSVSDFAVQDATTITLEADKNYIRGAEISTDKRFIVSERVTITGPSFTIDSVWEYTGTGTMFSGVDVEFFLASNLSVRCPDAVEIFSFQDTSPVNTSLVILKSCFAFSSGPSAVAAKKWGTFSELDSLIMDTCIASGLLAGLGIEDGITITGTPFNKLSINSVNFFTSEITFIGLDLGSAVIEKLFRVDNFVVDGPSGATGISGLASSLNVGTDIIAHIRDNEFLGSVTPLDGPSVSDLRYEFLNCPPLENSSKAADVFLTSPQTVSISSQNVFVPVGGSNWGSDFSERFTVDSAGLITYVSTVTAKFQIIMAATEISDNGDTINIAIAFNGTVSNKTIKSAVSIKAVESTSTGLFTLSENDTIQAFASNSDSTSNPEFQDFSVNAIKVT